MTRVALRADADLHIGAGHVMRCLALAEALRERGANVQLVSGRLSPRVLGLFRDVGAGVVECTSAWPDPRDPEATAAATYGSPGERWVVVDGYHFDAEYVRRLKACVRVAWIDDLNAIGMYDCDLVVNPNLGAERCTYQTGESTRVLTGAAYALVRRAFPSARRDRVPGRTRQLVITLGGADPKRLTARVVNAVLAAGLHDSRITVAVGPLNRSVAEMRLAVAGAPNVRVVQDPPDWPSLLARADLVITAAGSTAWEVAALGVPSILLMVADNQLRGALAMQEAKAAEVVRACEPVDLTELTDCVRRLWRDQERRLVMGDRARRLIDGRGAERIASWMLEEISEGAPLIRSVTRSDALQVWRINNEPSVRAQSFDPTPIPLDKHFDWFDERIESQFCRMYALAWGHDLVALVRYDRVGEKSHAELSFAVASQCRRLGLGTRVLADSWRIACDELQVPAVRGVVIDGNVASIGTFWRAGFMEAGTELRAGRVCRVFERRLL